MKILRLPVALLLILQFVAAPPAGAESLPYTLVDRDQYDIFAEDQAEKEEEALTIQDPPDDAQRTPEKPESPSFSTSSRVSFSICISSTG